LRERLKSSRARDDASLTEAERGAKTEDLPRAQGFNQLRKDLGEPPLLAMLTDEGFLPTTLSQGRLTLKSVPGDGCQRSGGLSRWPQPARNLPH